MTSQQHEQAMLSALSEQNRRDFYDARGREGEVQELYEFFMEYNGGLLLYED